MRIYVMVIVFIAFWLALASAAATVTEDLILKFAVFCITWPFWALAIGFFPCIVFLYITRPRRNYKGGWD